MNANVEPDKPAVASEAPREAVKRHKHRSAKMRGVWIAFVGRILAQFVGSAASILLGLAILHKYQTPAAKADQAPVAHKTVAYEGRVARPRVANGRQAPSLIVLPVDDFSTGGGQAQFARALTEIVTASLAENGSMSVLSRTTSTGLSTGGRFVPALAREFGVDLVLETSVVRSANRVRVVAQLIDGRSDEHLWSRRYDREVSDDLTVQSDLADAIARDLEAFLSVNATRGRALASLTTEVGASPSSNLPAGTATQLDAAGRLQTP